VGDELNTTLGVSLSNMDGDVLGLSLCNIEGVDVGCDDGDEDGNCSESSNQTWSMPLLRQAFNTKVKPSDESKHHDPTRDANTPPTNVHIM
jgi:hypothetical protein